VIRQKLIRGSLSKLTWVGRLVTSSHGIIKSTTNTDDSDILYMVVCCIILIFIFTPYIK